MHADEAERREADGGGHVADLAVLAFNERELHPAGGNVCAETHRRVAGPKPIGFGCNFCLAGLGMVAFDVNAFSEFADSLFCDLPIDLSQIGSRMFVFRVEQFFNEFPVVGQ